MDTSTRQELEELRQGLTRLERERRWWRIGSAALLGVVVLAGAAPRPPVTDELATRRLTIVDREGRPRVALGARGEGPVLAFLDEQGTVRFTLLVAGGESGLAFYDEQKRPQAWLTVSGEPGLWLYREGRTRVQIGPNFTLMGEQGRPRVVLGANRDGSGLMLQDERNGARISLVVTGPGPGLTLEDEQGRLRAALVFGGRGPVLNFFGPDGKAVWTAPEEMAR